MKYRLYRFAIEVLDEPTCSDKQLEDELMEFLEAWFEAVHVSVELVSADDVIGVTEELELAEA